MSEYRPGEIVDITIKDAWLYIDREGVELKCSSGVLRVYGPLVIVHRENAKQDRGAQ